MEAGEGPVMFTQSHEEETTIRRSMEAIASAVSDTTGLGIGRETATYSAAVSIETTTRLDRIREARLQGYEGDACGECGNFTLVRNGTCLKCNTCGATSGCS